MRCILLWLCLLLLLGVVVRGLWADNKRTFAVDWENDCFLKDGKPFRFIAGSFHYFRAHPDTWQRKLRTIRAAGLNAVTTYVEWSLHNPKDGVYIWQGIANLERFIELAKEEDLLVILRPGPYICAERDFGGFPYWLLTKYPNIQLRVANVDYMSEIRTWYRRLMPKVSPYLYANGGPIIMVQVENEYGSYACDKNYRLWLHEETLTYVEDKAVLFTNDGVNGLSCGHIDGVLSTLDFGATRNIKELWKELRRIQPKGPLVNAEFYPGWLTHWGEDMARTPISPIKDTFEAMLSSNASVNFYMFYGGTNFGFTAGANNGGPGRYQADITSYDYDAPMTEAGDPTSKYFALRDIIARYLPLPDIPVPVPLPKKHYGTVQLLRCCSLFSKAGRHHLSKGVVMADKPLTFEALNQYSGLVLYETFLPLLKRDPSVLHVPGLRDRAYIYVDDNFIGILARETPIYDLPITKSAGRKLQILVENQGRINYGYMMDFKGLTNNVTLDKKVLRNWNMTKFPLESYDDIANLIKIDGPKWNDISESNNNGMLNKGPALYYGNLNINGEIGPEDTYLDVSGWSKGLAFINGENIGRYWPLVGPQITLYIPKEVLRIGTNKIVLIEYQRASQTNEVTFTDVPKLDG
ncbi:ectoderm-expressed 3 isoform 1-T2 [Glossina fuscipes fuscipes]